MPGPLRDVEVSIVGLGLMGGSLAAALTEARACRRVVGITRRQATLTKALEMGIVDEGTCDPVQGVADAEVVILATPVRTIIELIGQLGALLRPGCLVSDLGSSKQLVQQAMEALPTHVQAIGGHPMCGKETCGLSSADASLFRSATYVLTPTTRTTESAMDLACALVRAIGAHPLILDAPTHDRLVAGISHLPYLAGLALVATAGNLGDDAVWRLASSGFRDASRLAASSETMMLDVLMTNRDQVGAMVTAFRHELGLLADALRAGDEDRLCHAMSAAADRRRRLYG